MNGRGQDMFDIDVDRALEALRLVWDDYYDIGFESGRWIATCRDGGRRTVTEDTPDALGRAIRADLRGEAGR